jgi:hypothetical protein
MSLIIDLPPPPRPGSPSKRADYITRCITLTMDMLATENDYHSHGIIAISISDDPWLHLTRPAVQEATCSWLGIPCCDVQVNLYPLNGFLLLLLTPAIRDKVLSHNAGLTVSRTKLQLLPWTRLTGAKATKIHLKIRLFIKGLPPHAYQVSMIQRLLPQDSIIEGIDNCHRNDNEASCCGMVLWAQNPDAIAKDGTLLLEEIHDWPQALWHFVDPMAADDRRPHIGLVQFLTYEVFIHLDNVTNFCPPVDDAAPWHMRHSFR